MSERKLNTIRDYADELQDKIELLEKQFGSVHPIYKEMGGLIRSLQVKIIDLGGVKTDYQGNILVSENQWERLKKAGHELDEIVENSVHRDDYKKSSDRLWEVINEVEGLEKCKGCKNTFPGDELSDCSGCGKWFCDNDLQWTSEEGEERFCHSCWFIIKKVEKAKGGNE